MPAPRDRFVQLVVMPGYVNALVGLTKTGRIFFCHATSGDWQEIPSTPPPKPEKRPAA